MAGFMLIQKNPQRSCFEFSAGISGVQKRLLATWFGLFINYSPLNSKTNRSSPKTGKIAFNKPAALTG
jgi:hypothetical protein